MSGEQTMQLILAIIGSNALFTFITFLIKRKDEKKDGIQALKQEMEKGFEEREDTGKARYEEHKEAIQELRDALIQLAKDAEERSELNKYMAKSLMALSHDKLVYLGKIYQRRGAITLAEKNNLNLIYKPYHDGLGGNSDGEGYFMYCMNLPVVTEEEALRMDNTNRQEQIRQLVN